MTAHEVIADALQREKLANPFSAHILAESVIAAIRGMSHDELRELRPDIATLYDATRDTANTRGDYILNLTDGRLRAIEQLHNEARGGPWCEHDGKTWPCPTTRALRGNP